MATKSKPIWIIFRPECSRWKAVSRSYFIKISLVPIFLVCFSFSTFVDFASAHIEHDPNHEHHNHEDGLFKDCEIVFENEDMRTRVRDECNKTNPIDENKVVETYPVDASLETFEFDDNCFTGCVYKAEKIMAEDGTLDREQVQHFFKSNMTSELYTKLTSLFYACIDTTNRIADKKEMDACRKASLHEFCVVKGIVASAHELLKMDC